jgi:uncharacterized lipoprotein YmbA
MIGIRSTLCFLILTAALGQLVSCAGLNPANKSLYALDPGRPTTARDSPQAQQTSTELGSVSREQVLQVRRVNIAPPFDGLSLIYRTPDGTCVKDYYNEWVAPPEELLSTQLVGWLSASAPFASVVDGRSAAPHRFALETCITSLYGDFQNPREPKVVLNARVYLIDDISSNRRVAYQNHYELSIPVSGASARQMVEGSGSAYRHLLEAMTQDLTAFRTTLVAAP